MIFCTDEDGGTCSVVMIFVPSPRWKIVMVVVTLAIITSYYISFQGAVCFSPWTSLFVIFFFFSSLLFGLDLPSTCLSFLYVSGLWMHCFIFRLLRSPSLPVSSFLFPCLPLSALTFFLFLSHPLPSLTDQFLPFLYCLPLAVLHFSCDTFHDIPLVCLYQYHHQKLSSISI